ncbi:MAG: acetaldehyde dehydrogenase (acetylating) [Ilumatobacteraceae bacterium]
MHAVKKIPAAIVGPGNIGTDLMFKLLRSELIEPRYMVGVDPDSAGLKLAREHGLEASHEGVDWLLSRDELPGIVFEATSAYVHVRNAPRYKKAGIFAVDLTPAARGPYVVPPVNLLEHIDEMNVNMVTCGGQATIPMVHAVSRVVGPLEYAEIVATVSSASAGPGTRNNIDEFTRTTSKAVEVLGGAKRGKAIIILNPADPPLMMRDTIFCQIPDDADHEKISKSIHDMVAEVQTYVPGYSLRAEPQFDVTDNGIARVATFIGSARRGRLRSPFAGNLDIMTAAAARWQRDRSSPPTAPRAPQGRTDMPYSDDLTIRITDTSLRDGSAAPPVHRGAGCAPSSGALDTIGMPVIEVTHGDGLGGSSFNYGFSKVDERVLEDRRRDREAGEDALMLPGLGIKEGHQGRPRPGWLSVSASPRTAPRPTSRSSTSAWRGHGHGDGGLLDDGPLPAARGVGAPGADHGRRRLPVRVRGRLGRGDDPRGRHGGGSRRFVPNWATTRPWASTVTRTSACRWPTA